MAGKDLRGLSEARLRPMLKDKKLGLTKIQIDTLFSLDPQPVGKNSGGVFANIFSAFHKFDFWLFMQEAAVLDLEAARQKFDKAKTDHRVAVVAVLNNDIDATVTGRAVLREITTSKHQCKIEPVVPGRGAHSFGTGG